MYVYKVWMNVREFWSVQALYVTTNALYWKFLEMQNSMHLTLLKHQNTKTSLYELSKNHWVITLLGIFGSDRKNLQFTVPLDHPVVVASRSSFPDRLPVNMAHRSGNSLENVLLGPFSVHQRV